MFTVILVAIGYIAASIYIGVHVGKWLRAYETRGHFWSSFFLVLYGICALTPVVSGIVPETFPFYRFLKVFSNWQMAAMLYAGLSVIVCDIIALIGRITLKKPLFRRRTLTRAVGLTSFLFVVGILVFGAYKANQLKVSTYDVDIVKKAGNVRELKIVAVSDTHFGYNAGVKRAEKLVKAIKEARPDLVLLLGDTFDNNFDAIEKPDEIAALFASIKSTYGTFAIWGNHDYNENLFMGFTSGAGNNPDDSEYKAFFQKAKITVLQDESLLIDDSFYLIGREDPGRASKFKKERKKTGELTKDLNENLPVICMDHQPKEYDMLAAAGVDLDLSGHTHGGQMFPGNLFTGAMFQNDAGLLKVRNMTTLTTSGAGVWGPPVRIGTESEIMVINVKFMP